MFDARAIDVLRNVFADVCLDKLATLVETDGEADTVHLAHGVGGLTARYTVLHNCAALDSSASAAAAPNAATS